MLIIVCTNFALHLVLTSLRNIQDILVEDFSKIFEKALLVSTDFGAPRDQLILNDTSTTASPQRPQPAPPSISIQLFDLSLSDQLPCDIWEANLSALNSRIPVAVVKSVMSMLHDANPKLGVRGCKLAVTFPALYEMEVRAIMLAYISVCRNTNADFDAEELIASQNKNEVDEPPLSILVPGANSVKELQFMVKLIHQIAEEVIKYLCIFNN